MPRNRPEVAIFLPGGQEVTLEQVFAGDPWGYERNIRIPYGSLVVKHWFSYPPFYLEIGATDPNSHFRLPFGYNELHAIASSDMTIIYVL